MSQQHNFEQIVSVVELSGGVWQATGLDQLGHRVKGFSTDNRQEAINRCLSFIRCSVNPPPTKIARL
jgi:hypothetical protein